MDKNKKHTILPNSIRVQLIGSDGENIAIENVLSHLKIYSDSLSWYNLSYIPTDSNGIIYLTKEEIIENTELKYSYDEKLVLDTSPVKFEVFIIDTETLNTIVNSIRQYLSVSPESIKDDLKKRGLSESGISKAMIGVLQRQRDDKNLYDLLVQNKNSDLEYTVEKSKIIGVWEKEKDFEYKMKVKGRQQ